MGDLIVLTPSRSSASLGLPPLGSAEILFFTGVRYYRMTDALPECAAPKRRRRPTKVKTIAAAARPEPHAAQRAVPDRQKREPQGLELQVLELQA